MTFGIMHQQLASITTNYIIYEMVTYLRVYKMQQRPLFHTFTFNSEYTMLALKCNMHTDLPHILIILHITYELRV